MNWDSSPPDINILPSMTIIYSTGFNGITDTDAAAYIAAVEQADAAAGQPGGLEYAVAKAYNDFVVGCKEDRIWDAIKASCILAGARTLNGVLVPLVGAAPTNFNFVAGDYNRKTGLIGDRSTKYLDSNRNNNADPQDSKHISLYISSLDTSGTLIRYSSSESGGSTGQTRIQANGASGAFWINSSFGANSPVAAGFAGMSRSRSSEFSHRRSSATVISASTSQTPNNANIVFYQTGTSGGYSSARLAFYSIGEALDLALLDSRVTTLINAIGAAIP